jgi:hypothetical protein
MDPTLPVEPEFGISARERIQSKDLADHFSALERLIAPFGDQDSHLKELRDIMNRRNLQAHVTFFWRGPPPEPNILLSRRLRLRH